MDLTKQVRTDYLKNDTARYQIKTVHYSNSKSKLI